MNQPRTYRKRPVEIQAMQLIGTTPEMHAVYKWVEANTDGSFNCDNYVWRDTVFVPPEGLPKSGISIEPATGNFVLAAPKCLNVAEPGDYIIRDTKGNFYPCKPEIFEATYDEVKP